MGVASGCGEQEVGVASGSGCKEVYRFPHTTYPYSSCICTFLQQPMGGQKCQKYSPHIM